MAIGERGEAIRPGLRQSQERHVVQPVRTQEFGLGRRSVVEENPGPRPGFRALGVCDVGLRKDEALGRDDNPGRPDERDDRRESRLDRGLDTLLESRKVRRPSAGIVGVGTCLTPRRLLSEERAERPRRVDDRHSHNGCEQLLQSHREQPFLLEKPRSGGLETCDLALHMLNAGALHDWITTNMKA